MQTKNETQMLHYKNCNLYQSCILLRPYSENTQTIPEVSSTIVLSNFLNPDKLYSYILWQLHEWFDASGIPLQEGKLRWHIEAQNDLPKEFILENQYIQSYYWDLLALYENYGEKKYTAFMEWLNVHNTELENVDDFWELVNCVFRL
ncbi:MAG: hypothetical protein KDD49_05755 [Bacteroidetes bacterium]|nr:hypothetical protein [Bacteroidota bacterium]